MPRSLSLTALQVTALTTSDDTILYNAQSRDISLYGGTNIASLLTQLEINNTSGDCLTLRFNGDANNYANFKMNSTGTFDVKINNGNKSFNIVNHNGSTFGLKLGGTLVTSTAVELNKLSGFAGTFTNLDYLTGITPGTATASKALVTDASNNLVGINDLSTQNLTVAGTLVTASATELNYTDITTAGTAQAAKALIVDVNKDIASIRNLTATSLSATNVTGTNVTGTLQTASQPNITTVGTLGALTVTNQISAGSLLVNGSDISALIAANDISSGVTPGTVSASKVLLVDSSKNLTGMGNLTSTGTVTAATLAGALSTASQPNVTTLAGVTSVGASSATTLTGTLQSAAQSNVTSVGTLTSLTSNGNVNVASHDGSTQGLKLAGTLVTATANEMNKLSGLTASTAELNAVAGVTPGTVSISKALVVDGNKDLSGIRNITTTGSITGAVGISATTLTGTLATAAQPNITSVGTLSGLTVTNQINVGTLDAAAILVNGVDITTSISGSDPTNGITPGVVSASKVLLVDSSKNLTGMGNLTSTGTITASTLTGTLSTASQSNVTSVGTLTGLSSNGNVDVVQHDGSTQGFKLAGTLVTAVASDLNKLTSITNGTTSASKALVVDINKDLTGIRNLTSTGTVSATTLTGALSTASQSNVTSVGTLTGLTSNGNVDVAQHDGSTQGLKLQGTLVTATAADLNKLTNVTGGTVSASKALVVDINQDLSGIRNLTTTGTISGVTTLTATTLAGALSTASQPNVTSVGTLTSLTSNGNVDVAQHNGTTTGFKLAGTLVTATAADLNKLASVTASAAELNTSAGVTAGTVTASKALVVDSNKDLSGIRNLTSTGTISGVSTLTAATVSATTLTGTLSAGAQNNITTLTGATSVGQNSSTILTGTLAAGAQPNITTLAGVTSVGQNSSTVLTGTLATAAQPNVTSVGTLSSLALSGGISGATTISGSGILTNTNTTDSTSNSTGAVVVSGGVGISKLTDATSSTNGGALTVAGGAAIQKKLYVGSDLTVGGNLTISGTTTTINSTTTTITDNTLLLNSGPAGTGYDAGVLTQRYQIDNSAGTGDIVSDTAKETYAIVSGTVSAITLPSGANAANSYYNNWWIKITSGTQLNQVRKITAYNGTTKVATLSTNLGGAPSSSDNINLYNKSFTSLLWNESSKKFVSAFTSNDTTTPGALTIIDYADFTAKNITGTLATAAQPNVTSVGTLTSLTASGNISTTGTGTITSAGLLTASAGLTVNGTLTLSSLSTSGNISTTGTGTITSAGLLTASAGLTASGAVSTSGNISTTGTGTITSAGLLSIGNSAVSASSWTTSGIQFRTAATTYTNTTAGTATSAVFNSFARPTLAASSALTTTNAATVYIDDAPAAGSNTTISNPYSLWVAKGNILFGTGANLTSFGRIMMTTDGAGYSHFSGTGVEINTIASGNTEGGMGTYSNHPLYMYTNNVERMRLAANGTISISSTEASTSSTTGALRVAGGAYFATGSLFGGLLTASAAINTRISDTGITTLVYPLSVSHLLSSGTPTANSFGIGMKFDGPNINNTTISYARIFSTCQASTLNAHQGNLTISTVFGGNFVDAITIASSSATSSTLTINGASSSLSLPGASAKLTIANTTASTSSSTGALQVAGGAYFGEDSLFAGVISFSVINTEKVSTTLPASCISLFDNPIYFRGSVGNDKNHFISYCGNINQTTWNAGKGFGNPATANDGPVICGYNNVIIGTLAGGSTETICGNFTSTGLALGGGSPTCRLDLGLTATNMGINLYAGTFGLGAMNGFLNYYGNTSHKWWNTQADVRLGVSQGTNTMTLGGTGNLSTTGSITASSGNITASSGNITASSGNITASSGRIQLTSSGFGYSHFSGVNSVELNTFADGSSCSLGSYSNHPFGLYANNSSQRLTVQTNGQIAIGTSSNQLGTNIYPLIIRTYCASTETAASAEKFSTTSGGSNWDGNAWGNCSARFNDILVASAFIGVSDERIKTNIEEIPIAFCKEFVMNCTPVSYFLKEDLRRGRNNTQFGYIAQDLEKKGFHYLVTHMDDNNEDLIEIIEDVNGREYKSPEGVLLSVSYTEIIPLLAQNIKALYLENENQQTKITNLEQKNVDLESRLAKLEAFISTLEITE